MFEYYFSTGEEKKTSNFYGAENTFKWTTDFFYSATDWFELRCGLGGYLSFIYYIYQYKESLIESNGGLFLYLDAEFQLPIKIIRFQLLNKVDIFFGNNTAYPRYSGAIRFIVNPYLKWIGFFAEIGGETFHRYNKDINIRSGYFFWGLGVQFDIDTALIKREFTEIKNKMDIIRNNVKYRDDNKNKNTNNEKNDVIRIQIEKLTNAKKEDIIIFNNILFQSDSAIIYGESYAALDAIVCVLMEKKNISIEIGGFTHRVGNPKEELKLSVDRAKAVAEYIIYKGISPNRIKAVGYGGTKPLDNAELNRRVEIKILDIMDE